MRKRLGFLGLLASLIIVFFSNSSFAAGYSCTKTYLSCKPGYYLSGEDCLVCPVGKYCTGRTTAPQNCPAGTYRNATGGTSSSSCTACAVGSYSSAGASSCRACQDGKTTSGTGKTSCDTSCSNVSGASTWADATWTANTVTNKCAISTCSTGYTKGGSANSSGASSYTCSANCNKITLNNTTRGGSGGTTAVYKKTGSATWYSNSNCSTSITSVTKPSKTNATYAGTYTTNASSGGTQCITSSGALSTSSSCNVSSAATWYARYTCNTNYTGSGTNITGACTASPITITLNKNGGTGTSGGATGTTSGTITCYYNTACTLPSWNSSTNNITNGNKIFKGWATTSTATSGSTSMTFTAADTLYAVWVTPTCSVTNGSGTITTPSSNAPRCSVTCDSGYSQSGGTNTTTSFTATGSAGGTSVSTSCKARSYSCSEGKYLNGVTCTTCTANYYCGGGTWTYNGGVQGRSTCSGGTGGLYTKSAAGTSSVNSCYLTTTKGKFVETAKAGEETCTAGGYCPGGVTVYYNTGTTTGGRTACSTLANGFYPNSAAGSDAANDCYTNSLSGKYVASAKASSAKTCPNWTYKGSHTVKYGSVSSCSSCPAQTSGWTRGTGTGWTSYSSCYQTKSATVVSSYCSSGQLKQVGASSTTWGTATVSSAFNAKPGAYVTGSGTSSTCSQCTSGYYCPGGTTTRQSCSSLADGFYPNSAAGSDGASDCYTDSLSGKYVASKNASSATNCKPGYFKGAHTVKYGSISSCSACTGATYADVEGLASCKTCPTATTYKDRVTRYWYWAEDGIQDSKYGCRATISLSSSAHGTYSMSCALSSSNEDYGIGGGSTQCMASSISKCSSGYYAPNGSSSVWKSSINNLEASVCVPAGTGYFSGDGSLTRTACTSVYSNTTTTTTTATSSSSCVCKAGYGGTSASACNACAKGTYKSSAGTVACSSAGSGYYVDTTAATSRKSCTSLGAIYTASDSGYDASTDCYATTSAGKWLASAKATAFSTCSAGDYCPGSIKVYYNSTGGKKDCPSNYPNSGSGSSLITQCYSNTKSRAWTGSQVNGSTPTNCYSVTAWNSCSKPACDYVAYSNSAGTGDGTIKSGCSSNSANCTKTADTTTGKSGYYGYSGGNGQACSSCSSFNSSYPSSDNGAANSNYCYATKTKYGSQVNGAVPTNCYSVTSWNSCSPGSCTYRDYYGISDTTCTPSNCTKSPAAVTAKSGYYVSGVTCPACSGLASGFYPNSNNGNTGGASACYTNSLSGKYVASKNASSAKTCPNWTYKGSHTVKYGSVSSCSSCPALTSGWSKKNSSGTGWTSYTSCVQVSPTPSNCSSGNLKQTATSSTTWGSSSVNTALSASPKYYVKGTSCSACPAGSYCSGGTAAATKCAIGSYSTGTASACTVCGAGKTTSSTGTTGSSSCISCSSISGLSSWATPSWKANSVSNLCTVSTCSANYYKSGNSCPTCSSGTDGLYTKSAAGTTSVNSCYLTTTAGKYVATENAGEVTCAAGGWCPGGITIYYNTGTTTGGRTACSSLGTGYTNTSTGQSKNTSCYLPVTAGKVRVGTSGTSLDTCDAGTYKAAHNAYYGTSYSCSVCDTNKYSDAGAASCTSCDTADGYGNSGTSASSHAGVSSCKVTCDAGEYVATAGGGCVSVGSGYYTSASKTVAQNATSSRSACSSLTGVSVSGGTYSSVSPYNASSTCRYKGPSKTISGCNTVTTNTVAYSGSAWPATTYSVSAKAGYYISSNGTASATCTKCTGGYYCTGGTTARVACAVGSYSAAGASACIACQSGKTTSAAGQTSCNATCSNATGAGTWTTATWSPNSVDNICTINGCSSGYSLSGGNCIICPAGKYCLGGKYAPQNCSAGTYRSSTGGTSTDSCSACAVGSYSAAGASACIACQSGKTTSAAGQTSCNANCSNATGVSTWTTATWSANSVSNLCAVSKCATNYYKNGNACPTCSSGTNGLYTKSAAGTASVNSCYLTTTDGKYVATAKAGETICPTGYYCPGGVTVYYNTGTTIGGSIACSGATYADTEGLVSCKTCPTATVYKDRVTSYWYWAEDDIQDSKYGCRAYIEEDDPNGEYLVSCGLSSTDDDYGVTGSASQCMAHRIDSCVGGYYSPNGTTSKASSIEDMKTKACVSVGSGYYSLEDSLTRIACEAGLTTIGFGAGADEPADCGRVLNIGDEKIYLRSEKKTTPSLNVSINGDIFYGNMGTSGKGSLKIKSGSTTYSVYDDSM